MKSIIERIKEWIKELDEIEIYIAISNRKNYIFQFDLNDWKYYQVHCRIEDLKEQLRKIGLLKKEELNQSENLDDIPF